MKTFIVKVVLSNTIVMTIEGNVPVKSRLDLIPSGSNLLYGGGNDRGERVDYKLDFIFRHLSIIHEEENRECKYSCQLLPGHTWDEATGPLADTFGEWFHYLKLDYTIIEMGNAEFTMHVHQN